MKQHEQDCLQRLDVARLAQAMETVLAPTLREAGVIWGPGSTSAAVQVAAEYMRLFGGAR